MCCSALVSSSWVIDRDVWCCHIWYCKAKNKWWAWPIWPNALESRLCPPKCSGFSDFENESIDFHSFFFPRFWWSHHGDNVMSLSFSFCTHRWAFNGIKVWVLRTPCDVFSKISPCTLDVATENYIFASFHYFFFEIFNLLVKFCKHSSILVIRKYITRLRAHGQTNGALFSAFFLSSVLQSWLTVVSFLLPIFQVNH